jgi:hypothetical protein
MANTFVTNKKVDLVALRAAEAAGYLTVGSKSYFGDQLEGKRNGVTYEFVIRDAGQYATGMDMTGKVSNLVERKVSKDIKLGNIVIDTNLLEKVTDVQWEKEIAIPNGKKLINGVVADVVKSDLGLQNTAFVGKGWLPISKASRFLGSISTEDKFGFIDPMIDSIMAAGGKGFDPVETEPLYKTGMMGKAFGTEFRESQFMPTLEISKDLADELVSATVSSFTSNNDGTAQLKLSGVTETIPAGTPLFVAGVYATDLVGDKTSALKAFIAIEDATSGNVKVRDVDFNGVGTKEACDKDGNAIATLAGKKLVNTIEEGQYFTGIIRLDGAMEFDTLKKLDWSNADSTSDSVEGVIVHEGRAVDVITGSNKTRWTVASLAGIVEPRAVTYVCVKDATANLVTM